MWFCLRSVVRYSVRDHIPACSSYLVPSPGSNAAGFTELGFLKLKHGRSSTAELPRGFLWQDSRLDRLDHTLHPCGVHTMYTVHTPSTHAGSSSCGFLRPVVPPSQGRCPPFLPRPLLVGRLSCSDSSSADTSATTAKFCAASASSSSSAGPCPALWPRTAKLVDGILAGSRTSLSRAITLGERLRRCVRRMRCPERELHGGESEGGAGRRVVFSPATAVVRISIPKSLLLSSWENIVSDGTCLVTCALRERGGVTDKSMPSTEPVALSAPKPAPRSRAP